MGTEAVGNPWFLSLDLCRALEEHGIEVVLVVMGRKLSEEQRRAARQIASVTLEEHPLRVEWMDDPWDDVAKAAEVLLALERRDTPDIVHLHGYAHAALPFQAPVVISAHTDLLGWWEATRRDATPRAFDVYRERARLGLRAAAAVVSATRAEFSELTRRVGPCSNPKVIPIGCDTRLFAPDTKEELILSASRSWDGVRNLELLQTACDRLRWPVYAAADDTRPPATTPRPEAPDSGVRSLGYLSRSGLAEWLGRAAVYALPGSIDPSGLSVMEAALAGCAMVLGETEPLREVWTDAALFVANDDPVDLTAALNRLSEEPELRHSLGERAHERARGFGMSSSARAYLALYEELLGGDGAADADAARLA
jgi:glycogen(starch) synthase